jgi:hypothetical protein
MLGLLNVEGMRSKVVEVSRSCYDIPSKNLINAYSSVQGPHLIYYKELLSIGLGLIPKARCRGSGNITVIPRDWLNAA